MDVIRVKSVVRQRSFRERFRIWYQDVIWAIKAFPSRQTRDFVPVYPGQEGYNEANWRFDIDPSPMRFEVKDGVPTKK